MSKENNPSLGFDSKVEAVLEHGDAGNFEHLQEVLKSNKALIDAKRKEKDKGEGLEDNREEQTIHDRRQGS